jgi:PAS domain-containing protein
MIIARMRLAIEHEQAERALRASKARLQFALDAALLGWWQYDRRRCVASGDTRFKEIFDVTTDEMPNEEIKKLRAGHMREEPAWGGPDRTRSSCCDLGRPIWSRRFF